MNLPTKKQKLGVIKNWKVSSLRLCSCAPLHCFQGSCYFRSVPRSPVLTVCKCASVAGGNHKTPQDTVLLQFLAFCNKLSISITSTTIYQIITNYLYLFHKMSIFGSPILIQNSHAKYCNTVQYRCFSTHLYHLCCVPVPILSNFFRVWKQRVGLMSVMVWWKSFCLLSSARVELSGTLRRYSSGLHWQPNAVGMNVSHGGVNVEGKSVTSMLLTCLTKNLIFCHTK